MVTDLEQVLAWSGWRRRELTAGQRQLRPELSIGLLRDSIGCNASIRPRRFRPKDTVVNSDRLATVS